MQTTITLDSKAVQIELTAAAEQAARDLDRPLVAEIHLIMGCLVVKRVWFKTNSERECVPVTGLLHACFRTVRYTKTCRISHIDQELEEPTDFPLAADKCAFVPDWLKIDFKAGKWLGTFGYTRSQLPAASA